MVSEFNYYLLISLLDCCDYGSLFIISSTINIYIYSTNIICYCLFNFNFNINVVHGYRTINCCLQFLMFRTNTNFSFTHLNIKLILSITSKVIFFSHPHHSSTL